MNDVSSWVLSIAGVICLSVLIELVMPEGQMNKYIKSIFSFVIILVIILPLPKLIKKEIDDSNLFNYQEIELQTDYLKEINLSKVTSITKSINSDLEEMGYLNVNLSISADIFDEKMDYRGIYVNLRDLVILDNSRHKNIVEIKEDIKVVIAKYIDFGQVYFEE